MKKFLSLLLFVILCSYVYAGFDGEGDFGSGENPPPPEGSELIVDITQPCDTPIIPFGVAISFFGSVDGGFTPYTFDWTFCANCDPPSATEQNGQVVFYDVGLQDISLIVTDNFLNEKSDLCNVFVELAKIEYPEDNTYWGSFEDMPFNGFVSWNDSGLSYWWDFGDATVNANHDGVRTLLNPPGVQYTAGGDYTVSLTVSNGDSISQSDSISIHIFEPLELAFGCYMGVGSCDPVEMELLRLFRPVNSHARTLDDPEKNSYNYPICCISPSLQVIATEDVGAPGLFVQTYADSDTMGPPSSGGGSHSGFETNREYTEIDNPYRYFATVCDDSINQYCVEEGYEGGEAGTFIGHEGPCAHWDGDIWIGSYQNRYTAICYNYKPTINLYEFTSYLGVGSECHPLELGETGKCNDTGFKCVYEFYPGIDSPFPAHLSNCTTDTEPNRYGDLTWAMCCDIEEDCTNNVDDNENLWFDCVDAGVCSDPGNERPCGISNNFNHDPTCSWMSSECDDVGCDFTAYSVPYYHSVLDTFGFMVPSESYPDCRIFYVDENIGWQTIGCASGTDETSIIVPQSANDAVAGINAQYSQFGVSTDKYELYFNCKYYHCSKGQDPIDTPLPALVEDMQSNSEQARHCCPMGRYWDVNSLTCEDFIECYRPDDEFDEFHCQSDFNNNFSGWYSDLNGSYWDEGHINYPDDCILEEEINNGNTDDVLCCPVWMNNENTWEMTDIEYFIV
ncbi:hypothetical protein CMO90_03545 [Candidatus Woesearchaeota archaeon]|nr:hypothetical protein [Candidatus Woesearchaeota archaeon]